MMKESNVKIMTFVKAIDKEFFDSFINLGQICMNTAKWFRDYENLDNNIGDSFEGAKMACGHGMKVMIGDPIKSYNSKEEYLEQLKNINWTELTNNATNCKFHDLQENANIFSLYAITDDSLDEINGNYLVDKKFIKEFSNHRFVIFVRPLDFLLRMKEAISKLGKSMESKMVDYYKLDEKLIENLTYFDKPDRFKYQNEFRLMFKDKNAEKQIINIGTLNEICIEIDLSKKYIILSNDKGSIIKLADEN